MLHPDTPDQFLLSRGTAAIAASRAWWRLPSSRRRLHQLAVAYFEHAREAKRMARALDEIVADAQEQAFAAEYAAFVPPRLCHDNRALAELQRVCRDHAERGRV